jgi:hypothetical protein
MGIITDKKICEYPCYPWQKTTMLEIPEKLKWYMPLGLKNSQNELSIAWRTSVDQMTGCIEIKRAPLVRLPGVLFGIGLGAFAFVMLFVLKSVEPTDDAELLHVQMLWMILSPPFLFFVAVGLDATATLRNSRYWKGSLRFRFNPQNGELFFPRENVTYSRMDYSKLVLGCIRGREIVWNEKIFGVRLKRKKGVARRRSTQIFMLVLDQNDEWHRYNLADDYNSDSNAWKTSESGNKHYVKLVDQLQSLLTFDQFVRDYSRDECCTQQQEQCRSTG